MIREEDRIETFGCAENETAEWLRVKCSYYLVIIRLQASRHYIDASFFFFSISHY